MAGETAKNLEQIRMRIDNACRRCGRSPDGVRLVAVSKKVTPGKIQEALDAGVSILGENYIQELRGKVEALGRVPAWHFIGHLQSNKSKYVVELCDLVHSVDSPHLAASLDAAAEKKGRVMPVLVQVNISGEESKHGINPQTTLELIREIAGMPHLQVQGLMTMPPLTNTPEDARPYFTALRKLRDEIASQTPSQVRLQELSMGMSSDFEVAIEEGATLVRIGTLLFGARQ